MNPANSNKLKVEKKKRAHAPFKMPFQFSLVFWLLRIATVGAIGLIALIILYFCVADVKHNLFFKCAEWLFGLMFFIPCWAGMVLDFAKKRKAKKAR